MKQTAQASGFRRGRSRTIPVTAAVMACLAISWAGVAGPASATPSQWESYHFEYGGPDGLNEDFCGVPGLTLQQEGAVDGRERTTTHGPDGLSYYYDHAIQYTDTWTNVETGESVTDVGSYRGGALHVTDNGDGTLTVIVQNTGHSSMYNEDGQRIYHSAGVFRFELLFDHAGTPTNPDDDEFLAFVGVLKHTGRDDGFCETLVGELG